MSNHKDTSVVYREEEPKGEAEFEDKSSIVQYMRYLLAIQGSFW